MLQLSHPTVSYPMIMQTSVEILDEFSILLNEYSIKFPDGSEISTNKKNTLGNEAYELLMESIQAKLKKLIKK